MSAWLAVGPAPVTPGPPDRFPPVTVLIVSRNRREDLRVNLARLRRVAYPRLDVVVVDDASTDGTPQSLREFPEVQLVRLERNVGPAAARNIGFRAARGELLFLLDSDAFPGRHALRRLVDAMVRDAAVGIIGCRIVSPRTRRLDQWIYPHSAATHVNRSFETYSFSAAGALLRRSVVDAVGGFWEPLVMYNEEVDLSIRAIRAGFRVTYCPTAKVFHHTPAQRRNAGDRYWHLQVRNRLWITRRHYPPRHAVARSAVHAALSLCKGIYNGRARACWRGVLDGLGAMPHEPAPTGRLSPAQIAHLDRLNPRRRVMWRQ